MQGDGRHVRHPALVLVQSDEVDVGDRGVVAGEAWGRVRLGGCLAVGGWITQRHPLVNTLSHTHLHLLVSTPSDASITHPPPAARPPASRPPTPRCRWRRPPSRAPLCASRCRRAPAGGGWAGAFGGFVWFGFGLSTACDRQRQCALRSALSAAAVNLQRDYSAAKDSSPTSTSFISFRRLPAHSMEAVTEACLNFALRSATDSRTARRPSPSIWSGISDVRV